MLAARGGLLPGGARGCRRTYTSKPPIRLVSQVRNPNESVPRSSGRFSYT